MRVLIDLNVLLDHFRSRPPWDADALLRANRAGQFTGYAASFCRRSTTSCGRRPTGRRPSGPCACLDDLSIIPTDVAALEQAYAGTGTDFEDNLQLACALAANLDAVVTRDPAGFAGSPIPVLSPAALLARLPPAPPGP